MSPAWKPWQRTISDTYYQQDVRAPPDGPFEATISVIDLGRVSLSSIVSSPVIYRRRMARFPPERRAITSSPYRWPAIGFDQQDLRFHCPANSFLMERGDLSLRTPSTERQRTGCCEKYLTPCSRGIYRAGPHLRVRLSRRSQSRDCSSTSFDRLFATAARSNLPTMRA